MPFLKYEYELQIRRKETDLNFEPIGTPVSSDKRSRAEGKLRKLHPEYFEKGKVAAWRVVPLGRSDEQPTPKPVQLPLRAA